MTEVVSFGTICFVYATQDTRVPMIPRLAFSDSALLGGREWLTSTLPPWLMLPVQCERGYLSPVYML